LEAFCYDEFMAEVNTERIFQLLRNKGFTVNPGLTDKDIIRIESAFKTKMPEDYKSLLKAGVPSGEGFPDWSNPKKEAKSTWKWIDKAFEFDIKNSEYWFEEFGDKPVDTKRAVKRALKSIHKWPPFFPVFSHRFMASAPGNAGNPVVSLYQAVDSIIYGANIEEYFANEFDSERKTSISQYVVNIPHWSAAFNLPSTHHPSQ